MNEFQIIKQYFQHQKIKRPDVILGQGDDCALLQVPANQLLAVSMDTLIAGVHFPETTSAYDIGYKSLAVNLSDLAAVGAEPAWFTCALTLPDNNPDWLKSFSEGLFSLAESYGVQLVGGDLTRGNLSITIQVHGFVPPGLALRRDKAEVCDKIYVSGMLGVAAFALKQLKAGKPVEEKFLRYLNRPEPQVALGIFLRGKARSAIDISDGLVADLTHILTASQVGATIYIDKLPLHSELPETHRLALTGGDDYQLCFTLPPDFILENIENRDITCIGHIDENKGLRIYQPDGILFNLNTMGYRHF